MIVRCGACRAQFEIAGEGRFACPACGTQNEVRRTPGAPDPGVLRREPAAPRTPDPPSPKVACPSCGFSFIVGDIAAAPCPMCGETVPVKGEET